VSARLDPAAGRGGPGELLTAREAAAELRCHERTVRRMIGRGELPACLVAGRYLIARGDLPRAMTVFPDQGTPYPRPRPAKPRGRFTALAERIIETRR
jgi:excisionase family DNA binding protein